MSMEGGKPFIELDLKLRPGLVEEIARAHHAYVCRFRGDPETLLLNPEDYAALQFSYFKTVRYEPMYFQGMDVLIKESGPPECAINPEHVAQALYEQKKGKGQ